MHKTTISIDANVFSAAACVVGKENVGVWMERLAEVTLQYMANAEPSEEVYAGYAAMAADTDRELQASEWTANTFHDFSVNADETR